MVTRRSVGRGAVIAYRAAVHGLAGPASSSADVLLDAGVQDYPTGASARLALRLRGRDGGGVLVHGVRAAGHLHHADDLGLLAGALRIDDGNDLARPSIGPFGSEIGTGFGTAVDEVAGAMRMVMSDGVARIKGELSGAVTPHVDRRLAPWCQGCGVHHVHDALFRYASLQAGLTIEVETSRLWRFLPPADYERADTDVARAELVRRFLRLAGPAAPARLADWLALTPAAGRRWWELVAGELEQVDVAAARCRSTRPTARCWPTRPRRSAYGSSRRTTRYSRPPTAH